MSEVAGRLEIEVTSDTKGFGAALKRKLEAITKEVVAEVRATIDTDGMKADLETGVKKASEGVEAKIGVSLKDRAEVALRAQLERVARVASEGVNAHLGVKVNEKDRKSLGDLIKDRRRRLEVDARVNKQGFFRSWLEARAMVQADAKRKPIELALTPHSGRSAFFPLFIAGIISLIQPLIGTIGGALGGLASMVANLANSLGVLAAAPTVLGGLVGGFLAVKGVVSALNGDMKKMPKRVHEVADEFQAMGKRLKEAFQQNSWAFIERNEKALKALTKAMPFLSDAQGKLLHSTDAATTSLAKWVTSKAFSKQFLSVSDDAATVWGSTTQALVGWGKGLLNIADAATPLVERVSKFIKRTGEWASGIAAPGKKAKEFGDWLKYAGDKASQMWRILKDLGAGIAGVFRAGRDTGDGLLKTLEDSVDKWRDWVESASGQNKIKQWFADIEPIAREAGGLVKDVVLALVRMSQDPNIGNMLKTLRTELLPTLERFLTNMGQQLGPSVIGLIQNLLEVLTEMSDAGSPIARGIGFISTALGGLAAFFRDNPRIATTVGVLLGGLMAYRALAFIGKATGLIQLFDVLNRRLGGGGMTSLVGGFSLVIAGLSGSLSGLPGPANGAAAALGTFMLLQGRIPAMNRALDGMRLQFMYLQDAGRAKGGGFRGIASAIGTSAKSGIRGALTGLGRLVGVGTAALGGPVGLGLAAVSTAVGIWAQKHADAKAAAQAYKGYVDDIVASLEAESGALTEASRLRVNEELASNGAAQAARQYGIDLDLLSQAALGNKDKQVALNIALGESALKMTLARDSTGVLARALGDAHISQGDFAKALMEGGAAIDPYVDKMMQAAQGDEYMLGVLETLIPGLYTAADGQRVVADKAGVSAKAVQAAAEKYNLLADLSGKSKEQVQGVIDTIAKTKGKDVKVGALTESAVAKLKSLGYTVTYNTKNKKFTIKASADTSAAMRAITQASRTRYATIFVKTRMTGRVRLPNGTYVNAGQFADGGILDSVRAFADGGITKAAQAVGARVRHFAAGAENHIAQIARGGEWRVWAEPETGGEAYIPLAQSKRARSMSILSEVAQRFGMALAPRVDGLGRAAAGLNAAMPGLAQAFSGAQPGGFNHQGQRVSQHFAPGSIQVTNPTPEPASRSIASNLRGVTEYGILEGDD